MEKNSNSIKRKKGKEQFMKEKEFLLKNPSKKNTTLHRECRRFIKHNETFRLEKIETKYYSIPEMKRKIK